MSGTTLPSSARAASIRARLASRRKLARLPSLEARAESRPQPLKLAWVSSSGQNKRRSRPLSQRPARADLPTPLGPARSMTLRSVAVWSSKLRARWFCGVSSQAWVDSSLKGTAVAPHCRANNERSRLGAFFISIGSLDLAVELCVDRFGQAEGGAPIGDLDAVELERVETQLHREGAQAQVHFVELVAQADRAVAAHGAGQLMVKKLVQVQMRIQCFDQVGAALVAFGGGHAGAGVDAGVIDTLQPERELDVEFIEVAGSLAGQAQIGLKILLDGEEYPLGFSLGPGMVRLGVEQPDAQVGAHDPSMVIGERATLVGVELGGQAAAAQSFLKGLMESLGIGPQVISRKRNEPRVIIDDDTQGSGKGLGPVGGLQVGAGGKVGHPQVVDKRRLEALGGATHRLAQLLTPSLGMQLMLTQEPVNGVERGQLWVLFAPAPAEHFDRHGQMSLGLFEDPLLLLSSQRAGLAFVGAHLGRQSGEAPLLVIIPPIFDGARGAQPLAAVGQAHGTKAHLFQGRRKGKTLAQEVLYLGDEGKTLQCERLRVRNLRFVFHGNRSSAPKRSGEENPFVGSYPAGHCWPPTPNQTARCRPLRGRSQTGVIA